MFRRAAPQRSHGKDDLLEGRYPAPRHSVPRPNSLQWRTPSRHPTFELCGSAICLTVCSCGPQYTKHYPDWLLSSPPLTLPPGDR